LGDICGMRFTKQPPVARTTEFRGDERLCLVAILPA
jgi:hypothetical protein